MIKIRCTGCQKILKLKMETIPSSGVRLKCPNCGTHRILKRTQKKQEDSSQVPEKPRQEAKEKGQVKKQDEIPVPEKILIECPNCRARLSAKKENIPDKEIRIKCRRCKKLFVYRKPSPEQTDSRISRKTAQSIMWNLLEDDEKKEFANISKDLDDKEHLDDLEETLDNLDDPEKEHLLNISEETLDRELSESRENSLISGEVDKTEDHSAEEKTLSDPEKPKISEQENQPAKIIQLPLRGKQGDKGFGEAAQNLDQEEYGEQLEESADGVESQPVSGKKTEQSSRYRKSIPKKYLVGFPVIAGLILICYLFIQSGYIREIVSQPVGFIFSGYMERADYQRAEQLYGQGNYDLAKNAIDRALEKNPSNKDYRSLKIACQLWLNPGLLKEITGEGVCAIRGLDDLLKNSEDIQIKAKVVDAMSRLGKREVVPLLINTIHTGIPNDLKRKIIEALGVLKDPTSVPTLSDAIIIDDVSIRFAVCTALGEIGNQQGAPALAQALRDSDFTVRYKAAEALQKIGGDSGAVILIEALKNKNVPNKENILIALGKIGQPSAVESIGKIFKRNLLKNGDLLLRHAATVALGDIDDKLSFDILKDAIMRPETPDKQDIVAALGKIEGEYVIKCLKQIIEDKRNFSKTVQREAAYSLLEKGDPETIPILELAVKQKLLDQSDLELTLQQKVP